MAYTQKNMQGALFKNKRKVADNHPDYTGTITIDGRVYTLAGWVRESKSTNSKFLSLVASVPRGREPGSDE